MTPASATPVAQWRSGDKMAMQKLIVCENGIVAAIVGREHFAKVALWSLTGRGAATWSVSENDRYALTNDRYVVVFDVLVNAGQPRVTRVERVIAGGDGGNSTLGYVTKRYLVTSRARGTLLMVQRLILFATKTVLFVVFEASPPPARWVEMPHLAGGESLFVGRMCSRAMLAGASRRRKLFGDGAVVPGDRIFFLTDDSAGMSFRAACRDWPLQHAAVYDMRYRRVTELPPA
uniref:KIB1-4 beta-propeller domain-containing protein n=1 Tax=Leersia perrieri TaxID=77586 RepID=A0A0D9XUB4_9ORYZ